MTLLNDVLDLTTRLISFAVLLQGLEILALRRSWSEKGIWKWSVLRKEFQRFPLAFLLSEKTFFGVVIAQIFFAGFGLFLTHTWILFFLWGSQILMALRWRGTFNGGSDYMTSLILGACFIASAFSEVSLVVMVCLGYITIQLILSYFLAGISKVRQSSWRQGQALTSMFVISSYATPRQVGSIALRFPGLMKALSWGVILFELTFPLAILSLQLAWIYLTLAVIFHYANFLIFGLNRFVWAWIATYPSFLFFCSLVEKG